jgi:hypothetical protein
MSEPVNPPAPASNPISVANALSDAFTYVTHGFRAFFRLSWKYLAFVVVAAVLVFGAIGYFAREQNEIAIYVLVGVGLFAGFLVSVTYYIVVVRNWLLQEEAPSVLPVFGSFLLRVVSLTILIVLAVAVIFFPPLFAGILAIDLLTGDGQPSGVLIVVAIIALIALGIFSVLAAIYLAGRMITWMIAAAVGDKQTLREGWNATSGAGLRIMGGMLGLTILFMIIDATLEASLSPVLGVNTEAFEKIATGASLPALFGLLLAKMLVFFPQTAASMVYCASIYRQASRR